ncbi:MAG: hypothetical protein LIP06_06445 [Tannerellaceae bacterium]|nr:hypothetical protein [Tannerellaceae bacterium]
MKKIIICLLVFFSCITIQAINNSTSDKNVEEGDIVNVVAEEDVALIVPPQVVKGGHIIIVNNKTNRSYTISAHAYEETSLYTYVPKGTYTVSAISMQGCDDANKRTVQYGSRYPARVKVGDVFDIEYEGYIYFICD